MLRQQFRLVDRAKQRRDGNLALAVDFDGDDVAVRGLELQPGAAVRNELRVAQVPPAGLVALDLDESRQGDYIGDARVRLDDVRNAELLIDNFSWDNHAHPLLKRLKRCSRYGNTAYRQRQ